VFPFAFGRFTSTPAIAATPLMRGLHVTAVHHIPAFAQVLTPFTKLVEQTITHSIKDNSRERRESKREVEGGIKELWASGWSLPWACMGGD
jgi:hypothetical protein